MNIKNIKFTVTAFIASLLFFGCSEVETVLNENASERAVANAVQFRGDFVQEDQMGRPAVNTVFVSSSSKDAFNTTIPSEQSAFQPMFEANLTALSPAYANPGDQNALGLDASTFTGLLATDVLNLSLDGTTTFFDGVNVLTGRALADDVITVELLLIFGGEDFTENPALSDDNVDSNDKEFLADFPYLASPW